MTTDDDDHLANVYLRWNYRKTLEIGTNINLFVFQLVYGIISNELEWEDGWMGLFIVPMNLIGWQ